MDFILEFFLEIYMELMVLIVPEKNVSKKHIWIAKITAVCVLIGLIVLVIWGVSLIVDKQNMLGVIPITIAAVLSLAQIVAGIILYNKHH